MNIGLYSGSINTLRSTATEAPVKFKNDKTILKPYLVASSFREIQWQDVSLFSE